MADCTLRTLWRRPFSLLLLLLPVCFAVAACTAFTLFVPATTHHCCASSLLAPPSAVASCAPCCDCAHSSTTYNLPNPLKGLHTLLATMHTPAIPATYSCNLSTIAMDIHTSSKHKLLKHKRSRQPTCI